MELWEHNQFNSRSCGIGGWKYGYSRKYEYKTTFQTVRDSERLASRKGDIVQFGSGYYERKFGDWRDWFPESDEDKKRFWNRREGVPKYADYQFAMIFNRYRWIKYKYTTFIDYGATIMFLTGTNPCRVRKYYGCHPYKIISRFPHIHKDGSIYVKMRKPFRVVRKTWFFNDFNLSKFIKDIIKKYGDTEETRDMFLQKIQKLLENQI